MIINLKEGEIELSEEENEVLNLDPGYAVFDRLDKVAMEEELAAMACKWRWEARKRQE